MKNKKELLKYGIQLLIAILTAIATFEFEVVSDTHVYSIQKKMISR